MGPTEPRNGRTIVQALFEELWKELDTIVEHITSEGEPDVTQYSFLAQLKDDVQKWAEWRGQAQGIAYALAVLTNPYAPDVDKIRAEAMERWEVGEEE
jgi:hypothetical protein